MKIKVEVLGIINSIRADKGEDPVKELVSGLSLRDDLGMDSFELALLTVKIEDVFGIDIFEDDIIYSVDEILEKLANAR